MSEKGHVRSDLALEVIIEDLGTLHGFVEGQTGNIPATEGKVVEVNHRENITDDPLQILCWCSQELVPLKSGEQVF